MKRHERKWMRLTCISLLVFLGACNLGNNGPSEPRDTLYIQLVAQVYTELYDHYNTYWLLQELASDELVYLERGVDCFCDLADIHTYAFDSGNELVNLTWNYLFRTVNKVNQTIEQVDGGVANGELSATLAEELKAELRAVRALVYFWALDAFGNIPIVDDFDQVNPVTSPRAEVYQFVENELNAVMPLLSKDVDATTYARMNFYVAQAVLAKLYLNAEVYRGFPAWNEALTAANQIIQSAEYGLEQNYFDCFDLGNSESSETILAIPYDVAFATGFNLAHMTLHQSSRATYGLAEEPINRLTSLQAFYNLYDDEDARKGEWGNRLVSGNFIAGPQFDAQGVPLNDNSFFDMNPDPDGPEVVFTPEIVSIEGAYQQDGVRVGKYEIQSATTRDMSNDMPLFRYSDILLVKAEALYNISAGSSDALNTVNEIRARAGVAPFDQLTESRLLDERGRELFAEGWRRQDMIRFGVLGEARAFKPATEPCRELFPIPLVQTQAGSNLSQNLCY